MPRKSKGGPREFVLSVRIPARIRYGLELASRIHRERVADLVVQALNDSLTSEAHGVFVTLPDESDTVYLLPKVWDARESVRLVRLALTAPSLLSGAEKALWEIVRDSDKYWGRPGPSKKGARQARLLEELKEEDLEADWESLRLDFERTRLSES
jgi:hypothetical protein